MGHVAKVREERCVVQYRTVAEVAEIMTARGHRMSAQAVQQMEQRALRKLQQALSDLYNGEWRDDG